VVLASIGGVGLGVLAARAWREQPRARAAVEEAATEEGSGGGATELAALRRRLARLEGESSAREQVAGGELRADVDRAEKVAARQQLAEKVKKYYTPELEAKRFTTYFDGLDQVRRAEGVDPQWATAMQASVTHALTEQGAIATLAARSVECGRTLCRIELDAKDASQKTAAIGEFLLGIGGDLPTASVHVPVSSGPITAYFARPGSELPAMATPESLVAELP
jgi:hypothetical protein